MLQFVNDRKTLIANCYLGLIAYLHPDMIEWEEFNVNERFNKKLYNSVRNKTFKELEKYGFNNNNLRNRSGKKFEKEIKRVRQYWEDLIGKCKPEEKRKLHFKQWRSLIKMAASYYSD